MDVPAPEVVVAICKKKALITIAALGGDEKCAVSAGCASRGERHQPLQLSSLLCCVNRGERCYTSKSHRATIVHLQMYKEKHYTKHFLQEFFKNC